MARIAWTGSSTGDGSNYPSRSEWLCAGIGVMIRDGWTDGANVDYVLALPFDHAISEHIADQNEPASAYVERQVRQIRERQAARDAEARADGDARVDEINEKHALVLAGDKHA